MKALSLPIQKLWPMLFFVDKQTNNRQAYNAPTYKCRGHKMFLHLSLSPSVASCLDASIGLWSLQPIVSLYHSQPIKRKTKKINFTNKSRAVTKCDLIPQ